MTDVHEATVEVLTAEVRVLMVGSRQVTLSVARQLDQVEPDDIEPFGRIRSSSGPRPRLPFAAADQIEVVGADRHGTLVRSAAAIMRYRCGDSPGRRVIFNGQQVLGRQCPDYPRGRDGDGPCWRGHTWLDKPAVWWEWSELPLIVLAGLR